MFRVICYTGGDDNRGGAVVSASIWLDGVAQPKVSLNDGAGWPNNSISSRDLPSPAGLAVARVTGITIEHDGAPRNFGETYDNWNLDRLVLQLIDGSQAVTLLDVPGVRFTGELTSRHFPIDPRRVYNFVTVFEHIDFGGRSFRMSPGDYTVIPGWNDVVSSMKVPRGLGLRVWEHANQTGLTNAYYSDAAWVGEEFNDKATAFRVR